MKVKCKVENDKFIEMDRIGYIHNKPNQFGLVLFYPVEGKHPYRIWLPYEHLKVIEEGAESM